MSEHTDSGIRRTIGNILDLVELQAQLIVIEAMAAKRQAVSAMICALIAILLGGAAFVVGLVASGLLLHEWTELSVGSSLSIVSAVAFLFVAVFGLSAAHRAHAATRTLSEVRSEVSENYTCLKSTLLYRRTPAAPKSSEK